jgi:hypothetical protein
MAAGDGRFVERSETHLPRVALSVGDAEPGDVAGNVIHDIIA